MKNKTKIFTITMVAFLALAVLGVGVVFAQDLTPTTDGEPAYGFMGGRGRMMGGTARTAEDWDSMDAMHQWMTSGDGMHASVWNALAEKLGMTSEELTTAVNNGSTLSQLAEEKGIARSDLLAALQTAHEGAIAQAVADGSLTQEQADEMLARMEGNYERMIDNPGAGYGMANGRGMMGGRYGPQGADGQFTPENCPGGMNWSTADPKPAP